MKYSGAYISPTKPKNVLQDPLESQTVHFLCWVLEQREHSRTTLTIPIDFDGAKISLLPSVDQPGISD
jgi:hypothetical protein